MFASALREAAAQCNLGSWEPPFNHTGAVTSGPCDTQNFPPGNRWRKLAVGTIVRDYHSTAVLLEDGSILTGGGDSREYVDGSATQCQYNTGRQAQAGAFDYQVFRPDYLTCGGPRPQILASSPTVLNYGQTAVISYSGLPGGVSISKVTLVRPGSVTHHADPNQRCVQLNFVNLVPVEGGPNQVSISMPTLQSGVLPRGYYMLHLVSNQNVATQGVPSAAHWVRVQ